MDNIRIGVLVSRGFEKAAVMQVRDILEKKDVDIKDTVVTFNVREWEDAYTFIYKNQIASRIFYMLGDFDYSSEDGLISGIRKVISAGNDLFLADLIRGNADFRATLKLDEHTDVTETEAEIGGILIDYARSKGSDIKVNLKNPLINLYAYCHNGHAFIGIDLSGDLSKRDYKIFNNAVSLKGTTAFGLLMIAGYRPKDFLLNPSCYSGIIEIEAALYAANISPRLYNKAFPFMRLAESIGSVKDDHWEKFFKRIDDQRIDVDKSGKIDTSICSITGSDKLLSSITAAKKNAKIAGVESLINFRRIDFDWMDIKYEKKSIDKLVSFIPGSSKHDRHLLKDFKEIFYQAEYILKDSGVVVIMCLSKDLLVEASKEHFSLEKEHSVHSGAQEMTVLFFKKK